MSQRETFASLSRAMFRGFVRDRPALPAVGILLGFAAALTLISVRVFRWGEI